MVLRIVDESTGQKVTEINGANYQSAPGAFDGIDPSFRAFSVRVAVQEGIVFASWIAPLDSPGALKIDVKGFESMAVEPMKSEKLVGSSSTGAMAPSLEDVSRIVTMRKSDQAPTSDGEKLQD